MRAILIDVYNKDVREIDIPENNTLDAWYKAIDVEIVTVGHYINEHDSILVDDEGLLKPCNHFFLYEGSHQPFAGSGLVTGVDEEGESVSCDISLDEVKNNVTFMTLKEVQEWVNEQN